METIVHASPSLDLPHTAPHDPEDLPLLPLRFALDLSHFAPGLRKSLPAAAALGLQAVQLDARGEITPALSTTALREVRKLLEDLNLRVSALTYRTRRGYSEPERIEPRVEGTKAALELAYALRAPVVINHLGPIPAETDSSRWKLLLDVLADLGTFAQRTGAMLAAETGGQNAADLTRLLATLPEGTLAVAFDPGSLARHGFPVTEAVEALAPAIAAVRLTDASRGSGYQPGEYVPLGRGCVDLPAVLSILERADYRGYLTLGAQNSNDPAADVRQALDYLRRL